MLGEFGFQLTTPGLTANVTTDISLFGVLLLIKGRYDTFLNVRIIQSHYVHQPTNTYEGTVFSYFRLQLSNAISVCPLAITGPDKEE